MQAVYEILNVPIEDAGDVENTVPDSVIGDASVLEIVSANLFRAISGADLRAPCRAESGACLLLLKLIEASEQDGARLDLVLKLAALILALHHDSGRYVSEADRSRHLLNVLSAGARRVIDV